jgi:hypothetical protein
MNLDDLMEVWRSQDAAPLHGVNETLLRLALRQDEGKLQATRRRLKWFVYGSLAVGVSLMVLFLATMIRSHSVVVLSAWDYVVVVVGIAALLILWSAVYVGHRTLARREQRFGESLRDQVNRQIAMIDPYLIKPWTMRVGRAKVLALIMMGLIFDAALGFIVPRLSNKPYDLAWRTAVIATLFGLLGGAVAYWLQRRWVRRDLMPRKRRLEALLKEFDG